MTQRRLDLELVWQDAMTLLRHNWRYSALILGICAVLPSLMSGWFGPDQKLLFEALTAASTGDMTSAHRAALAEQRLWSLPAFLLSAVGAVGLLHGWLARQAMSEGELLRATVRTALPAIVVNLLLVMATGIGLTALIIPGLFILGRLALSLPALVASQDRAIGQALRSSFAVTRGNVLRIVGMIVAVSLLWFLAGSMLVGLIAAVVAAVAGADAAAWVAAIPGALLAAGFLALLTALTAAMWRQLAVAPAGSSA